jgi:hypothetical protein
LFGFQETRLRLWGTIVFGLWIPDPVFDATPAVRGAFMAVGIDFSTDSLPAPTGMALGNSFLTPSPICRIETNSELSFHRGLLFSGNLLRAPQPSRSVCAISAASTLLPITGVLSTKKSQRCRFRGIAELLARPGRF